MKALVLEGVGKLSLVEREKPWCRWRTSFWFVSRPAGIRGTDRHLLPLGEFPSRPPVTLGHELAGIIEVVGGEVSGFHPRHATGSRPEYRLRTVSGMSPWSRQPSS